MSNVGALCNRTVYIARRDDSALEAARRMAEEHVGCLVIVEEREGVRIPIGMLTDRDLVRRVLAIPERRAADVPVGEIMSHHLATGRDAEPLTDVLGRMRARGVRRMPIVDARGGLVGILTFDDVFDHVMSELRDLGSLLARELSNEEEAPRAGTGAGGSI